MFSNAKLPVKWKNLLLNCENKNERFQFLEEECVSNDTGDKVITSIILYSVISSRDGQNPDGLEPCSHEKADKRTILHFKDAMKCEFKYVMIRTVDIHVVHGCCLFPGFT